MALEILPDVKLSERTTLKLGGVALAEILVRQETDVELLPQALEKIGGEPLVLGKGSNILAKDGALPLALVRLGWKSEAEVVSESTESMVVRVGASMALPRFLHWVAQKGLSGMEGLAGIPGEVGGAVAMNAGSYGCEIKDCLQRVRVFNEKLGLVWLDKDSFHTGYRTFQLISGEQNFIVVKAEFLLPKSTTKSVEELMQKNKIQKKATQPIDANSAGCVFKNPAPGVSTGMLLDKAGFKGKQLGGMAFSEKHANFLINLGHGTSAEAFELLDMAAEAVKSKFGHTLKKEVKVCPATQ